MELLYFLPLSPPALQSNPVASSTKVASLQRQLEALAARQEESEVAAKAAQAATSSSAGSGRGAECGGMLEAATRRCAEMEDRIDEVEGKSTPVSSSVSERQLYSLVMHGALYPNDA